ncbi:MAG: hypothetical protein KME10_06980 [Plectolyngbya sp. WJT66-NPBG17]|nr:hypothetical protein [Plectolyngbya sp. WJT66-NPBG17]MBW4525242.1 hypothetical protein [Phormidium tanganyikae FI6-MK23]
MSSPTSACTGFVSVLEDQQQTAIQQCGSTRSTLAKPHAKPHKLCTVVENGRVVVRPVEPPKIEPPSKPGSD